MPQALQKTLLKLGIAGGLALIVFNYPLLSLYRGHILGLPTLYVLLFGIWLLLILAARKIAEPFKPINLRQSADRIRHD